MFEAILLVLAFISPWLFKKLTLPSWISIVLLCYALGLAMSAAFGSPTLLHGPVHSLIQGCVVIAIPAMLLAASWSQLKKLGLTGFKAAISLWIGAAVAAFTLLYLVDVGSIRIGMIIAIFTGGLANLQAAGLILGLDEYNLVAANLGDVIAGGMLFLFLTSIGWPILKKLFGLSSKQNEHSSAVDPDAEVIVGQSPTRMDYLKSFGLAVGCVALAGGVSFLLPSEFLELGILGLGALLAISVGQRLEKSNGAQNQIATAGQNLGEYLMLVFCVLIGWSANWTAVGPEALVWAGQMGLFLLVQVAVSLVLAKALRVEPALYLMALVGCIYSPAFVPPIASTTKRYDLVPTGVFIGLIGLAIGTLIGVLFARGFA
ncbi:MAG: DUF819 family protein [Saprospiraceae bacterium]